MMTHRRNVKNAEAHVNAGPKKEHDRNHGNEPTGELHRNAEGSAQVIRPYGHATRMLLDCTWGEPTHQSLVWVA